MRCKLTQVNTFFQVRLHCCFHAYGVSQLTVSMFFRVDDDARFDTGLT